MTVWWIGDIVLLVVVVIEIIDETHGGLFYHLVIERGKSGRRVLISADDRRHFVVV